jgi:hypothetical protein
MAQIDSSIPLGVKPMQIESPVNQLAKILQLQNYQQQGELNQLTMEEKRSGVQQQNALTRAIQAPGFSWDDADHRTAAFAAAPTKANDLYKGHVELQGKLGENKKRDYDFNKERFGVVRRAAATHASDPNVSRDSVVSTLNAYTIGGLIPEHLAAQFVQTLPEDSAQLRQVLANFSKHELNGEQLLKMFAPDPKQIDNGQQIAYRDMNPHSPTYGQDTGGAPVQKVADPNATLQSTTSTENNKRTVAAQHANASATREVAAATRDAARIQTGYKSEQDLRKEFEALPETKKYKQALPSYKGIEDAVKRNTAQSDINIVYGIAKLYDPDSVVREGEYATVANSPNIPDRIKGYAQYLAGGGRLTPKVKGEILAEARSRMKSFEDQFVKSQSDFEIIAQRTGIDPTRVFPSPVQRMPADPGSNGGASGQKGAQPLPSNLTPQSLSVGQSYALPNGKTGRWNGQAFEVSQ